MRRADFVEHEYLTLRDEIKESKERLFRLAGLALIGPPSAYVFAEAQKLHTLAMTLPILVCSLVLLYLAESHAIMRCGRYIKTRIEGEKDNNGELLAGWETWLEERAKGERDRRVVDKYIALFFYIIFFLYYSAAVALAWDAARTLQLHSPWHEFIVGGYAALGVLLIVFLIWGYKDAIETA
jgi:hypothetical protein